MNYDELLEIADNATAGPWKASESCGEWSVAQSESPWELIALARHVYPECTIRIRGADAKYLEAFQPSVVRELLKDAARYKWLSKQDSDSKLFAAQGESSRFGECGHLEFDTKEDLDAAIDAAMLKEKPNGL